jgi:hypothetical protein
MSSNLPAKAHVFRSFLWRSPLAAQFIFLLPAAKLLFRAGRKVWKELATLLVALED